MSLRTCLVLGCLAIGSTAAAVEKLPVVTGSTRIDGRELFTREWLPNDKRSAAGDGLGPVFNDTSCVACHNQGGVGGAGPREKNAQFVSVFRLPGTKDWRPPAGKGLTPAELVAKPPTLSEQVQLEKEALIKIHPGLGVARSAAVHRFGTDAGYAAVRAHLLGGFQEVLDRVKPRHSWHAAPQPLPPPPIHSNLTQQGQILAEVTFRGVIGPRRLTHGNFVLIASERNTLPLFGAGLLDAIPAEELVKVAALQHPEFPEITGRVAQLKDGRIGRFGWKGQHARLSDFVLTACSVELGLEVPGRPQLASPVKPSYLPPGLDLTQAECDALTEFVARLPQPQQRKPATKQQREYLAEGAKWFGSVGCAICHPANLGTAQGIYSDLLLHDMGISLGDVAGYNGFLPNSAEDDEMGRPVPELAERPLFTRVDEAKLIGAVRQEWRTPPLWGVRDSAPYLHDGRAATLEQAIALHGGEAINSSRRYFALSWERQLMVLAFLRSLEAPAQ